MKGPSDIEDILSGLKKTPNTKSSLILPLNKQQQHKCLILEKKDLSQKKIMEVLLV